MNSLDDENLIFKAIRSERIELLDEALKNISDRINNPMKGGETALLESLRCSSSLFMEKLILNGADVNLGNCERVTPLFKAVCLKLYDTARFLIENGADVNIANIDGFTPLHAAVRNDDFEMVSMLLYHGADTSYIDGCGMCSYVVALVTNANQHIQDVLSEYEAFDCRLMDRTDCLPLLYPLLKSNINNSLEYLKLLFSSDYINDMIYYYDLFHSFKMLGREKESVFTLLIRSFHKHQLSEDQLLPFICITLSSGIAVTSRDVACLYHHYDNNKILDLFLHMKVDFSEIRNPPMLHLICYVQEDIEEFLFGYYKDYEYYRVSLQNLHVILDFHTPSGKLKEVLFRRFKHVCDERENKMDERIKMLIMPSLIELSRDASRKAIQEKYNLKSSYSFHTVLNNLPLPNYIRDVIKFKVPMNKR